LGCGFEVDGMASRYTQTAVHANFAAWLLKYVFTLQFALVEEGLILTGKKPAHSKPSPKKNQRKGAPPPHLNKKKRHAKKGRRRPR